MADSYKITAVWKADGTYEYVDDAGAPRDLTMKPPEHFTAALVGCAGLTMHGILEKMKVAHQGITITGFAVKAPEKPAWIESVALDIQIRSSEIDDEKLVKVMELTEKYCLIAQTIKKIPSVSWTQSVIQ
jgi:uncharacterized OsmC-like protein